MDARRGTKKRSQQVTKNSVSIEKGTIWQLKLLMDNLELILLDQSNVHVLHFYLLCKVR